MSEITEEEYEEIASRSYESGIISGMERAANLLLEKATLLWKNEEEEKANILKDYYKVIDGIAKELRIKYDEKHKKHLYGNN